MSRNRLFGRSTRRVQCFTGFVSIALLASAFSAPRAFAAENIIEEQLQEIGTIPNEEVMVVQRKYTRKRWRHELTPITLGGFPFNPVRRTVFGGASYTLHINDTWAWEAANFTYSKNFFGGFIDEINDNKTRVGQNDIKSDYQKLLFVFTTGIQFAPFYGKMASMSHYIAYMEPFFSLGVGMAKTETDMYPTIAPGIGFRVYFKEWFSMKLEFKNYLYNEKFTDRVTGQSATQMRSNFGIVSSLSFWLPKM